MNCKPGEYAFIVGVPYGVGPDVIGKIVRVVMIDHNGLWRLETGLLINCLVHGKTRDGNQVQPGPFLCEGFPDEHLQPIRDNDGEDETLQWAPVPMKEIA